jgi:HD-GYP domain-containing protein (c-di-GMP phosphodiesterase class II)
LCSGLALSAVRSEVSVDQTLEGGEQFAEVKTHAAPSRPRGDHRLLLERLARRACELVGGDSAVIMTRDRKDPRTSVCAGAYNASDAVVGQRYSADLGISGQVFGAEQPVVVKDYQALVPKATGQAASAPSVPAGLRGAVAVPVLWGDAVRAALSVATSDPQRAFDGAEIAQLCELAEFAAVVLENLEMRGRLEAVVASGVAALAATVELHDPSTAEHSQEVVQLALGVARRVGLSDTGLLELEFAARLHDLGKMGVPESVLSKAGPLNGVEWEVMQQHPGWGAELLEKIPGLEAVAMIIRAAHERWDGQGYPAGLKGREIPLASRIILACDAYHAMTSDRPYRRAMSAEAATKELFANAESQFDPTVVRALADTLQSHSVRQAQHTP